jgi:hypothetical protein
MGYHANAAPLDNTSHHNKPTLESECAAFRRSKKRLSFLRLRGNQDSINLYGGSKIKFIIQFPSGQKAFAFSDTEKRTIPDNVKSSAARQAWKHALNSVV